MARRLLTATLLAAAAACGDRASSNAPWLTYPGVDGHAAYLPLAGTPHDPRAPADPSKPTTTPVTCDRCHPGGTFTQFSCTGCHTQAQTDLIHVGVVTGYPQPPASADCYRCHRNGLGTFPEHGSRYFPIGPGTSHALGCTQCHSDLANRGDTSKLLCATCHAGLATFPGSHAAVSSFVPATVGSTDCVRCHADGQVDRVADHQAKLPVSAASATHRTVCIQCHTATRTDKPFGADFTTFNCLACHLNTGGTATLTTTDQIHAGLAGYAYDSASCYSCHPKGTGHSAFFPIKAGEAHAGIRCDQCHGNTSNPSDVAGLACASCHLADSGFFAHGPVPLGTRSVSILSVWTSRSTQVASLTLTSPNCLRCHADSQVDRVADHPADDDSLGNGEHVNRGCVTCHSSARSDKPYGADFGATAGCRQCHN